ncbi:hypothetical protein DOTSEDRAFT_36824 [Dothistroma septosporum NZE10]|uniref:Uncharacterized protein n=1 Tax=Dothistroma septosporum (strain NZE10 / CBS 128990) TaxID=675120 RepID=N1PFN1_DOTSN|nr:hypothetical protein DOTSEDRAFT_36824 [Dothistroma septosporum NZE10]
MSKRRFCPEGAVRTHRGTQSQVCDRPSRHQTSRSKIGCALPDAYTRGTLQNLMSFNSHLRRRFSEPGDLGWAAKEVMYKTVQGVSKPGAASELLAGHLMFAAAFVHRDQTVALRSPLERLKDFGLRVYLDTASQNDIAGDPSMRVKIPIFKISTFVFSLSLLHPTIHRPKLINLAHPHHAPSLIHIDDAWISSFHLYDTSDIIVRLVLGIAGSCNPPTEEILRRAQSPSTSPLLNPSTTITAELTFLTSSPQQGRLIAARNIDAAAACASHQEQPAVSDDQRRQSISHHIDHGFERPIIISQRGSRSHKRSPHLALEPITNDDQSSLTTNLIDRSLD